MVETTRTVQSGSTGLTVVQYFSFFFFLRGEGRGVGWGNEGGMGVRCMKRKSTSDSSSVSFLPRVVPLQEAIDQFVVKITVSSLPFFMWHHHLNRRVGLMADDGWLIQENGDPSSSRWNDGLEDEAHSPPPLSH